VDWSEELYRIYEADPHNLVPRPDLTIQQIYPADEEHYQQQVATPVAAGQPFDTALRIVTQKNNVRHLRVKGQPIFNDQGEVIKLVGTVADITDLKLTEMALRQSEERWSLAIDGSNDGIWDHDLITNRHFLPPAA
jgi:PAS domain-containing protein